MGTMIMDFSGRCNSVPVSYFIDRTYGDLWRGPTGEDNIHYCRLEGVCVDGSLIWVGYRSDPDPEWIPASYLVVEQTFESAFKSFYTRKQAEGK